MEERVSSMNQYVTATREGHSVQQSNGGVQVRTVFEKVSDSKEG